METVCRNRWIERSYDESRVDLLSRELSVSRLTARMLFGRGIVTPESARQFLDPRPENLHNPFMLPDMEKAVERIRSAFKKGEMILVYGDRDVDGITAVTCIVSTLKNLGYPALWYIPSTEGYGLNKDVIRKFKDERDISLIITADCGITSVDEVSYAGSLGIDVIVTDHHKPPGELPSAFALVDPLRTDSLYPFKGLAGCAVAFKLMQAIMMSYDTYYNKEFVVLDIETTGLHPHIDEICELSCVKIRNFVVTGTFHTFIKPVKPVSAKARKVNRITEEVLKDAPDVKGAMCALADFTGDSPLVIHNADFVMSFLEHTYRKYTNESISVPVIDLFMLARDLFSLRSHKLADLAKDLHLGCKPINRAFHDALLAASLFERLMYAENKRMMHFFMDNLDMVMLGTIADIMPLTGENRIFVRYGLAAVHSSSRKGVRKLLEVARISPENEVCVRDISWGVVPVLNAAGRMDRADVGVSLLLSEENYKAEKYIGELAGMNVERRTLQSVNLKTFEKLIQEQCSPEKDPVIFVAAEGVEHGVTGLVATQFVRHYRKPVVILIIDGETAMGSGRSMEGWNITKALGNCSDLLVKYGGHDLACGLTVRTGNIGRLKERLFRLASEHISAAGITRDIYIDMVLRTEDISHQMLKEMQSLKPFGPGNQEPVFAVMGEHIQDPVKFGMGGGHVKFKIGKGRHMREVIGWGMGERFSELKALGEADIAFCLNRDSYRGRSGLRLILMDVKGSG